MDSLLGGVLSAAVSSVITSGGEVLVRVFWQSSRREESGVFERKGNLPSAPSIDQAASREWTRPHETPYSTSLRYGPALSASSQLSNVYLYFQDHFPQVGIIYLTLF